MTGLLTAAISGLEKAGLKVDWEPELPMDPTDSHQVYLTLMRSATSVRQREDEISELAERARKLAPGDKSSAATVARAVTMNHRDWLAVNNRRARMAAAWQQFFDTHDIFLCPTAASAAFPHDHEGQRADRTITVNGKPEPTVDQLFWAGYSGVCYLPSTVAPAGITAAGLPAGLQIVAAHLADRTAIHFARLMRDAIGGFLPPAGYD
jgi:amidase